MTPIALSLPHDPAAIEREEFRRAFAAQLARLPALQARAFTLREVDGMAPASICARLAITEEHLGELLLEARLAMCRALASLLPTA